MGKCVLASLPDDDPWTAVCLQPHTQRGKGGREGREGGRRGEEGGEGREGGREREGREGGEGRGGRGGEGREGGRWTEGGEVRLNIICISHSLFPRSK